MESCDRSDSSVVPEVDVWRIALDQLTTEYQAYWDLLDQFEQARAARFHFCEDRTRYVLSHGALRHILARYLPQSAASLKIESAAKGKPFVAGEKISFNLSHTQQMALVAVSVGGEVGIDVEFQRAGLDALGLARRFFHEEEYQQLAALAPAARTAFFYRLWTCKEAVVKAHGTGISENLDKFAVMISGASMIIRWDERATFVTRQLSLTPVEVPSSYCAALAAHPEATVRIFDW